MPKIAEIPPHIASNHSLGFRIELIGAAKRGSKCNFIVMKNWSAARGAEFGPCGSTASQEYVYLSTAPDPKTKGRVHKPIELVFLRCNRHLPEVSHG
jgi:hypothetical protein